VNSKKQEAGPVLTFKWVTFVMPLVAVWLLAAAFEEKRDG